MASIFPTASRALLILPIALSACTGGSGDAADSGVNPGFIPDAGPFDPDAGPFDPDAGPFDPDASTAVPDAAVPTADGGPTDDLDGDGFTPAQGDCNDDPISGFLIGPDAVEIPADGVDNDCDGLVDESIPACPTNLGGALALAAAMDICHEVVQASQPAFVNPVSTGMLTSFGNSYVPAVGPDFVVLSTGRAGDASDPGYEDHSSALDTQETPHPDPAAGDGCVSADGPTVLDYTEVALTLDVPANALGFSFDFNFMSIEFPEFLCTAFDDTFLVSLESAGFNGNVVFDALGNRMSINGSLVNVCNPQLDPSCTGEADLIGTGFEDADASGAGTGWLTTTAPVTPGEQINLKFMIFDEGDQILDSLVLLDNFRWRFDPVGIPVTSP